MVDYSKEKVNEMYHSITGLTALDASLFDLFFEVANEKVQSDGFRTEELKIIAACYYIAYLVSGAETSADGKYASVSKSIGSVSQSVSLGHGTESSNAWLDRYNALITNEAAGTIGGTKVHFSPPATGYVDNATRRHVMRWWRQNGRL